LASAEPMTLRIDDRCNDPKHVNPANDTPTSVYTQATRASQKVDGIPDGYQVAVQCYVYGQPTEDAASNHSRLWLRIAKPAGYMPDVDTGGGFSVGELKALSIGECPS
jgi:hypothetical protein